MSFEIAVLAILVVTYLFKKEVIQNMEMFKLAFLVFLGDFVLVNIFSVIATNASSRGVMQGFSITATVLSTILLTGVLIIYAMSVMSSSKSK